MTTGIDPGKPSRNAADTRERILDAARRCFSRKSYDNVGTRDIAGEARVDAALVNRYFGSKKDLFAEVIAGAFHLDEHLPASLDALGESLVHEIMREPLEGEGDFNPLRLLLLAVGSPDTVAIVSAQFHAEFVLPLAKLLRGRDAEMRAALIGSYLIGLATMRHLLESPPLVAAQQRKTALLVGAAIQACVG